MITDSRVGVHIPLPAGRPRQRSWGTSLPQSVIWCCIVSAPLAKHIGFPSFRTVPPGRNGLPLVLRCHVQPCWYTRYTCSEISPVPDAFSSAGRSGAPFVTLFATILPWGVSCATLLRTKHCDLAAWPTPLSPPWYPGGPRAEGLAIAAWGWWCENNNDKTNEDGKASLAGFIVNQELKKRISREKCPVLGL